MEYLMKLFKPTMVAIALVSVMGCQEAKQETAKDEAAVTATASTFENEVQKQSYGLGASIGMYMQRNLEEQTKLGVTLEKDLIVKGFTESLDGKSQITQDEIKTLLQGLDQQMKDKQAEITAKVAADALAEGQAYLAENGAREGVMQTESGIQYEIVTAADGAKPLATDTVKVHYRGTFINGETFDSSYDRNEPAVFPLNRVIRGWTEGVQLMSVGSKYKFTIPSDLAYGPAGNQRIPGNAVLNFEIELLEIQKQEQPAEVGDKPAEDAKPAASE